MKKGYYTVSGDKEFGPGLQTAGDETWPEDNPELDLPAAMRAEYERKLREWEAEGFDTSELREKYKWLRKK